MSTNRRNAMRSTGCRACLASVKDDLLLQKMATTGPLAILHSGVLPGGANETRTRDPLLAKQVLFQLSYSPKRLRAALQGTCASR